MNGKFGQFINTTKGYLSKHSPEILTGIGVTGMITSTVLAVSATPKALQLLEEANLRTTLILGLLDPICIGVIQNDRLAGNLDTQHIGMRVDTLDLILARISHQSLFAVREQFCFSIQLRRSRRCLSFFACQI